MAYAHVIAEQEAVRPHDKLKKSRARTFEHSGSRNKRAPGRNRVPSSAECRGCDYCEMNPKLYERRTHFVSNPDTAAPLVAEVSTSSTRCVYTTESFGFGLSV